MRPRLPFSCQQPRCKNWERVFSLLGDFWERAREEGNRGEARKIVKLMVALLDSGPRVAEECERETNILHEY